MRGGGRRFPGGARVNFLILIILIIIIIIIDCHCFFHHHCHHNYHDDLRCAGRPSTTIRTITTTTTTMTTTTIRLSLLLNPHLLYHANMFHSTKTTLLRLQRSLRRRKSLSRQLCHHSNRSIHFSDHTLAPQCAGRHFETKGAHPCTSSSGQGGGKRVLEDFF